MYDISAPVALIALITAVMGLSSELTDSKCLLDHHPLPETDLMVRIENYYPVGRGKNNNVPLQCSTTYNSCVYGILVILNHQVSLWEVLPSTAFWTGRRVAGGHPLVVVFRFFIHMVKHFHCSSILFD